MLVVNQLSGFGSRRRVSGGGGGYSCTMTAGDFSGVIQGYDSGVIVGSFGSFDVEPVPGHAFRAFVEAGSSAFLTFGGDATALFVGKEIYIAGVAYPDHGPPTYDGTTYTTFEWNSGVIPDFVSGNSYFVEIK